MIHKPNTAVRLIMRLICDYSEGGHLAFGEAKAGKSTLAESLLRFFQENRSCSGVAPKTESPVCYAGFMNTWGSAQVLNRLIELEAIEEKVANDVLSDFFEQSRFSVAHVMELLATRLTTTEEIERYVRLVQAFLSTSMEIEEAEGDIRKYESILSSEVKWVLLRENEGSVPVPAIRVGQRLFFVEGEGWCTLDDLILREITISVPSYSAMSKAGRVVLPLDEDLKDKYRALRSLMIDDMKKGYVSSSGDVPADTPALMATDVGSTLFVTNNQRSNGYGILSFTRGGDFESSFELSKEEFAEYIQDENHLGAVDTEEFGNWLDGEANRFTSEFEISKSEEHGNKKADLFTRLAEGLEELAPKRFHQFLAASDLYDELFANYRESMSAIQPYVDLLTPYLNPNDEGVLIYTEKLVSTLDLTCYSAMAHNEHLLKRQLSLHIFTSKGTVIVPADRTLLEASYGAMVMWKYSHVSTLDTSIVQQLAVATSIRRGGLHSSIQLIAQHISDRAYDMSHVAVLETRDDTTLGMDEEEGSTMSQGLMGGITRYAYHLSVIPNIKGRRLWFRAKTYKEYSVTDSNIVFDDVRLNHLPTPVVADTGNEIW